MGSSLKDQYATTPLFGSNASAVEALYEQYLADSAAVPAAWREYFESLGDPQNEVAHSRIREELLASARDGGRTRQLRPGSRKLAASSAEKQAAVARLIQVYSLRGHQIADIDPLGLMERRVPGVLKLDYLGLSEADMDTEFYTGGLAGSAIEKNVTTTAGVELEVELDNGELLAIVQEKDAVYNVGDRVRVLRDARGTARVRQ